MPRKSVRTYAPPSFDRCGAGHTPTNSKSVLSAFRAAATEPTKGQTMYIGIGTLLLIIILIIIFT